MLWIVSGYGTNYAREKMQFLQRKAGTVACTKKLCLVRSTYTALLWSLYGCTKAHWHGRAASTQVCTSASNKAAPASCPRASANPAYPSLSIASLRAGLHERSQTRAWHPQGVWLLGTIVVLAHQSRGTVPCVVRPCGSTCPGQFVLASFHVPLNPCLSLLFADFTL